MTKRMNTILKFFTAWILLIGMAVQIITPTVSAAPVSDWQAGYIVSDHVFTNPGTMSAGQIQSFLNSKVPFCDTYGTKTSEYGGGTRAQWGQANYGQSTFTCLKNYTQNGKSAAQIIYDTAQKYTINPQVLLVLLQKEQGLVTDEWPLNIQYRSATGYGCPDTAPCDSQYYGLTNQLDWAGKMFRAIMNDSPTWFTPYEVGNNYIRYNPNASCGGSTVNILNRSTQALYNYTPYQPNAYALNGGGSSAYPNCGAFGNRNFYTYFSSWFGSTRGDYCITSLTDVSTGVNFAKQSNRVDLGVFQIYSGASTGCIESHTWNTGARSWKNHASTNSSSINTANSSVHYADLDGNGVDEPILVGLRGTGSGKIEFHVWNPGQKSWKSHAASNFPTIDPAISQVAFADLDGNGKDEAILIGFANGSTGTGKIEMHIWNPGFGTWRDHVTTNAGSIDKSLTQLLFADIDGNGKDEGILISTKRSVSGSGNIEMHVWDPSLRGWREHIATNQPAS